MAAIPSSRNDPLGTEGGEVGESIDRLVHRRGDYVSRAKSYMNDVGCISPDRAVSSSDRSVEFGGRRARTVVARTGNNQGAEMCRELPSITDDEILRRPEGDDLRRGVNHPLRSTVALG